MNNILKKIFILPIKLYQFLISPIIGGKNCCRFMPTCSQYAVEAIEQLGVIKGTKAAIYRIFRCNPWGSSGYDPVNNVHNNKVLKIK